MNTISNDPNHCVENGIWTAIPQTKTPVAPMMLEFAEIDPAEANQIDATQIMTFHSVGCSGDPDHPLPGSAVAQAMVQASSSIGDPPASFLFHLGDIVYKPDDNADSSAAAANDAPKPDDKQATLYTQQFYQQYASYPKEIFAIAGNHDGKGAKPGKKPGSAAIQHFLDNFCATERAIPEDDLNAMRRTMIQPYPYWVLATPVAYIIGLYTNVANGGLLDDPAGGATPQLTWLTDTLTAIKQRNDGKVIVLTLHYPVYSGSTNFAQRGDPNAIRSLDPTTKQPSHPEAQVSGASTLATLLQAAFAKTTCYPDIVLSAHAHLYQRITYTYADGRQIPFLIAGCGGHFPLEDLAQSCCGATAPSPTIPFPCILPVGTTLPTNETATVVAYEDQTFGFLQLTIDLKAGQIRGSFISIDSGAEDPVISLKKADDFTIDLKLNRVG